MKIFICYTAEVSFVCRLKNDWTIAICHESFIIFRISIC